MVELKVIPDICHGCGNCVVACPINASRCAEIAGGKGSSGDEDLIISVENGTVIIKNPDICTKCATCVRTCPVQAIRIGA